MWSAKPETEGDKGVPIIDKAEMDQYLQRQEEDKQAAQRALEQQAAEVRIVQ
jgi:hypothetical protein